MLTAEFPGRNSGFSIAENTDDLFVGKTLLREDVLMWLMKTLLTSLCVNQREQVNGAENYVNNVALPDMAKGIAWFWTIRNRETPDKVMGLICLYDEEDNNRGFWLAPEY